MFFLYAVTFMMIYGKLIHITSPLSWHLVSPSPIHNLKDFSVIFQSSLRHSGASFGTHFGTKFRRFLRTFGRIKFNNEEALILNHSLINIQSNHSLKPPFVSRNVLK
jgi:hypothetical protein